MEKVNYVKDEKILECELIGVFQYSEVIGESPFIGGHKGGTISHPVAVLKFGNDIFQTKISNILKL